jgi:hypothetical protein
VQVKAALDYVLSGQLPPTPSPTPTPTPGPNPSPTPTPTPGNAGVTLSNLFVRYNGQLGTDMSKYQVKPGTTIEQTAMISNTGDVADSFTMTIGGIPDAWWTLSGYNGGTLEPDTAASMKLQITPAANAAAGTYTVTLTATPTPGPNPTPTPTPTPGGYAFSGAASSSGDYYVYVVPAQAGQITAQVSWAGTTNDVNLYLYSPDGNLVAKSEQRYTTSETVQYNAPKAGYYLVKVQAKNAYKPVSFTGTATATVQTACVKTGTIAKGQVVSLSVNPGSAGSVNARLIWGWSFYAPTMSLFGPNGGKVADAGSFKESWTSTYAHLNYAPAAAGTYVLKVDGTKLSGMLNYKLITPYQL